MATRVSLITLTDGSLAVTKTPLSGDRRDRRAEGHWLQRATEVLVDQQLGSDTTSQSVAGTTQRARVVPLLGIEQTPGQPPSAATIVTARVAGETLRTTWLAPAGVASALSLVADLLADLHTHGLAHGNLSVDHIILHPTGPHLCSPHGAVTDPLADTSALGHCVRSMLERWDRLQVKVPNRHEWERLETSLHASAPLPMQRAARALDRLASPVEPSRAARDQASRSEAGSRTTRPWGLLAGGTIGAASLVGLAIVALTSPATATTTTAIEIDGHEYELSGPAALATVIDGACDHQPLLAVLDADTDMVWQFDVSADAMRSPGSQTVGSIVAEVPGAEQLTIEGGELCPTVWAIGPAGRTLVIGEG